MTAAASETEINLWPYVLQLNVAYVAGIVAYMLVIYLTGWSGNSGVNSGILVAATLLPMQRFVHDHRRALTKRERLRFAVLGLVTSTLLWLAVVALFAALIMGTQGATSLVSGLQYVGPNYLTLMVVVFVLGCIVSFAVLYFMSGILSRIFHKQLTRQPKS